jgi:hypothetical protein
VSARRNRASLLAVVSLANRARNPVASPTNLAEGDLLGEIGMLSSDELSYFLQSN